MAGQAQQQAECAESGPKAPEDKAHEREEEEEQVPNQEAEMSGGEGI